MSEGQRLLLFVKSPQAGQVKTRLGASIGLAEAADAYRRLTHAVLRSLPPEVPLRVCFAPDEAGPAIEAWLRPALLSPASFHPQGGGDLGERLARAFTAARAAGAERIVVIGSDCIDLSPALLREAFDRLATADAVLGPSTDGGYYLLGLRQNAPSLFRGIAWSTEQVLAQTLAGLDELGWSHSLLPTLTDVDTLAEWQAVAHRV